MTRPAASRPLLATNPLLDPDARLVVGHRGAAAHAAENTLESFALALAGGADALELDVHLTADGEVVVMHDPRVDRTTVGTGEVATHSLAALRALGMRRDPASRVPTLDAVLESFPGVPMLVDAKARAVSAPLRRALERHGAESRVLVGSFNASHLAPFAGSRIGTLATRAQVIRLLLLGSVGSGTYAALAVPHRLGAFALPMRRLAAAARRAGRPVHVWTVNDAALASSLWQAGASGMVTDDPARLVAHRAGAAARAGDARPFSDRRGG